MFHLLHKLKRKISTVIVLLLAIGLFVFSAFQSESKPKILIIGDSISLGYTPYVQKNLASLAHVVHSPGNAQHTGTGLSKTAEWIATEKWDIILFNWGLWDLCYRHPDSQVQGNRDKARGKLTYSVDEYAANLDSIVTILHSAPAKLIFVTTSFVPEEEAGRYLEDALIYNAAAKEVMNKHGVQIHDFYKYSRRIHRKWGKGRDDVHYLPEGYAKLGSHISTRLRKEVHWWKKTRPTYP